MDNGNTLRHRWVFRIVFAISGIMAFSSVIAAPGDWLAAPGQSTPAINKRIHQPRPDSAPTAADGHAIMLTGTIEPRAAFPQPRPLSAPRRFEVSR